MIFLLKVVRLHFLEDELPHILHCVEGGVSALVDIEPRRVRLLTILFDSLAEVIINWVSTFFDFDRTTI